MKIQEKYNICKIMPAEPNTLRKMDQQNINSMVCKNSKWLNNIQIMLITRATRKFIWLILCLPKLPLVVK